MFAVIQRRNNSVLGWSAGNENEQKWMHSGPILQKKKKKLDE